MRRSASRAPSALAAVRMACASHANTPPASRWAISRAGATLASPACLWERVGAGRHRLQAKSIGASNREATGFRETGFSAWSQSAFAWWRLAAPCGRPRHPTSTHQLPSTRRSPGNSASASQPGQGSSEHSAAPRCEISDLAAIRSAGWGSPQAPIGSRQAQGVRLSLAGGRQGRRLAVCKCRANAAAARAPAGARGCPAPPLERAGPSSSRGGPVEAHWMAGFDAVLQACAQQPWTPRWPLITAARPRRPLAWLHACGAWIAACR